MTILLDTFQPITGHPVRVADANDSAATNKKKVIKTSIRSSLRRMLVMVLAVGLVIIVWGRKSASAFDDPPAVFIKLVSGQMPEVIPLNGPMPNAGIADQGIMIWSTGLRQFVQTCPIEKGKMSYEEELALGSRSEQLDTEECSQPGEALSLQTADLEQIRWTTQYKGKGFLTPAEKEHLLSGKICVRRSSSDRSIKYPAVTVEVIRGRKTLCEIPFAENQSLMKWADVPNLSESLKEGLSPGEYSLRAKGSGDSTVFVVDDIKKQDFVLQIPRQLAVILKTKSDPLFLQLAVDHLVRQVDENGVPCPYYSDALDLLDSASPDSLTPWLKGVREDILARLGADPTNKNAVPNNAEEQTGIESIDKARRLISEGRWDEATTILSRDDMPSSPRSKGLALLYRAVILSESSLSLEDETRTLFMNAITALSMEDPHDAYRAHINYAKFLTLRAQDQLYNHAFEIASGVPNSLNRGLINWRDALEQLELAGKIANGLDSESRAAVKISMARVHSLLADVLRTLSPSVNLKREVGLGEEAARQTAVSLCHALIADTSSSIQPMTRAAAFETLAHLAFRQGNMKDCRDHAQQAIMLYTEAGSLPGIESIHRLLGLMELRPYNSTLASDINVKAQEAALQHLRISHFLSEFLRCHIPSDRIGLARAGYFARRVYVNEQIVELLISSGRHAEALEFAELGKARSLQDILTAGEVHAGLDNRHIASVASMLAAWPEKTCAWEYFLGSTRAWVFVVQSDGKVQAYELRKPDGDAITSREIVALVRRFLSDITGLNRRGIKARAQAMEFDHQWQDEMYTLFHILVPEDAMTAIQKTDTLVVVPHHILHYIPFVALVTKPDTVHREPSEMVHPRFLIDEGCAVVYSPSLSIWHARRSIEATSITSVRGLGDAEFSNLPGITKDLANLSSAFGDLVKTICTGTEMHEAAAKSMLKSRGLLYIGSHGENQPDRPLDSRLLLRGNSLEDGDLTAKEIYDQTVGSDLVILSACYSGLADRSPMPGDDLFGLQRALLHSGARAVVSGQWDIDDHFGMLVIQELFVRLDRGENVSKALRGAQLAILDKYRQVDEGPRQVFCHPYFWSVFTVCGDDRVFVRKNAESKR